MTLFLHQILFFIVHWFFLTTMPVYFKNEGYNNIEVGILFFLFQFSNLILFALLTQFKFKGTYLKYLYLTEFISLLALFYLIENIFLSSIIILIIAMTHNLAFSYNDSIIVEQKKEHYGIYRSIGSMAFVIVSMLFYFLFNKEYNQLYFIILIISFTTFITSSIISKKTETMQHIYIKKEHFIKEKSFILFSIIYNIPLGIYLSFYSIYLIDKNYSMNQIYLIWAVSVLFEIIMLFIQHKIIDRNNFLNPINIMIISSLITVFRFAGLEIFIESFWMQIVLNTLHMFTFSIFFGSMIKYFYTKYPKEHFIYLKMYRGLGFGIGGSFGAILGGIIYYYYPEYLFYTAGFFSLISILFLLKK